MHSSSDISAMRTENLQIQTPTQKGTRDPAVVDPATVLPGRTSPPPGKLSPDELPTDILKPFGGQQLARTSKITSLDAAKPQARVIIYRFDSAERAQTWYNSPDQKKINDTRMKSTKPRPFVVQTCNYLHNISLVPRFRSSHHSAA